MPRKRTDPHTRKIIDEIENGIQLRERKKELTVLKSELKKLLIQTVDRYHLEKPEWNEFVDLYRDLGFLHDLIEINTVLISRYEAMILTSKSKTLSQKKKGSK